MTSDPIPHDHVLDALGLLCPLPVLKARKALLGLPSGQVLKLITDDPASIIDVPHFCAESGTLLRQQSNEAGVFTFFLEKP